MKRHVRASEFHSDNGYTEGNFFVYPSRNLKPNESLLLSLTIVEYISLEVFSFITGCHSNFFGVELSNFFVINAQTSASSTVEISDDLSLPCFASSSARSLLSTPTCAGTPCNRIFVVSFL